jgi:putative transposase
LFTRHKRRRAIAEWLPALLAKHPEETIEVAWDNAHTPGDDEIDAVVRSAAGRLVVLYLPPSSPWLHPIEMRWRHVRREVTPCALFESLKALVAAAEDFFARSHRCPERILSIIGAITTNLSACTELDFIHFSECE